MIDKIFKIYVLNVKSKIYTYLNLEYNFKNISIEYNIVF